MNDTLIILFVLTLAALVGAGIGGYLAAHQAGEKVAKEAEEFFDRAEQKLQDFKIEVPPVKVDVPPPVVKVEASISPWSAFWIFLATVAGIVGANVLRKSRLGKQLEIKIANKLNGSGRYGKKAGAKHKRRSPRA